MPELVDDQEVSRARHDLRTVVNHFEGYVLLLREDDEPWVRDLDVIGAFDQIDEAGREILQILDRTRTRRRNLSAVQVLAKLQANMEGPAMTVEGALIALGKVAGAAGHRDVERIQLANQRLRNFIKAGQVSGDAVTRNRADAPAGSSNPRVLVIEDDDGNRELLERMLTRFAYTVAAAASGAEALRAISAEPWDVILLDLMLPDIEGFELLERIRKLLPATPVIVISALNEVDNIVRCIEAGAEDYFAKPFIPTLLRTRVASAIDRKRYRELLAQAAAAKLG